MCNQKQHSWKFRAVPGGNNKLTTQLQYGGPADGSGDAYSRQENVNFVACRWMKDSTTEVVCGSTRSAASTGMKCKRGPGVASWIEILTLNAIHGACGVGLLLSVKSKPIIKGKPALFGGIKSGFWNYRGNKARYEHQPSSNYVIAAVVFLSGLRSNVMERDLIARFGRKRDTISPEKTML